MAALDTPWLAHIGSPMTSREDSASLGVTDPSYDTPTSGAPATIAAFSPVTLSANTPSRSARRSTVLVHQKSPLLLATPPQITRALAYSHPFILPLNTFVGLVTWSSGDPWQSFLLLCAFWATVLYGDVIVRWAGPVVVGVGLIVGMYGRRYSPLSSSGWNEPARDFKANAPAGTASAGNGANQSKGSKAPANDKSAKNQKQQQQQQKHIRGSSEVTNTKHQKTLDEIVETLKELTGRCNVLMEPLLEMTDFLSTQRTPTSATTKPALTAMFVRLLIVTPFWVALTMPPWRVVTTRRVVLVAGTLILTWHARVMRVTRALLWRSATVRSLSSAITGLQFEGPTKAAAHQKGSSVDLNQSKGPASELTKAIKRPNLTVSHRRQGSSNTSGVKFTFIIYENQRRWVGLGWTSSLFSYERAAWTDEHNNAVPPKDEFELPSVEDGSNMAWRWAQGSRWKVDGVSDDGGAVDYDADDGKNGWVYYDNKNGRRGLDGWARWTRRRKWYRDAELVELDESPEHPHELDASETPSATSPALHTTSYNTTDEKMVAYMRSEPALPVVTHSTTDTLSSLGNSAENASLRTVDDSTSLHSTSSRSIFWPPSLRRRTTDRSAITVATTDKERNARTSNEEEDVSGLGFEVELELQKQGKDGGEWGIGDEARMSLE